ncbi:hypothetical protein F5Y09DRAFT_338956 [Xylaria sp. FL1042]|nr:hypothetical protein F5Y09DRAFT_338956 [Xylaria sp. FL1042]
MSDEITNLHEGAIYTRLKGRTKKVNYEDLRTRQVQVWKPERDELIDRFKSLVIQKPIEVTFEQTENLQISLKNFLCKAEDAKHDENSYEAIKTLCNEINEWRATMRLAPITNREFDADLERCKSPYTSKAIFYRTILMSIIDRFHLRSAFDFNCEGEWSLQGTYPLPSTNGPDDVIIGPKPDLAIFFTFASLVGTDIISSSMAIPPDLKSCMNPDNHILRCFPFLFIETNNGIENAALSNLHSASQALLNIYAWMNRAYQNEQFFRDVRVFSIAINIEKLVVRVHRAKPLRSKNVTGLVFTYDDLYPDHKFLYTKDGICTLIYNILIEYSEKTLLGILKRAVEKVLKEHEQGLKRKSDATVCDRPPKRQVPAEFDCTQCEYIEPMFRG